MLAEPITVELTKPRRRLFQFRLRTMLIGMALLSIPCSYAGWQAKIAMDRGNERLWLEANGAVFHSYQYSIPNDRERDPPWLRRLFGDHRVDDILLKHVRGQRDRAEIAFPEAAIYEIEIPDPSDHTN